ncbi:MAG: LON peptidase substrate-binding domain-containing protein [Alphaproteobacteria bacterium]
MSKNPYAPDFKNLPVSLPVFPLTGVLLLPGGALPLNIFEQRYLDMVDSAFKADRMIGIIQPKTPNYDGMIDKPELSTIGCAGKITDFTQTSDGRYLISLNGICRFEVREELNVTTTYRQAKVDWSTYKDDLDSVGCIDLDREKLVPLLQKYFEKEGLECDWSMIEQTSDEKLITCLSMICPFEPQEKQALLEARCCNERASLFMTMLDIACSGEIDKSNMQH